MFEFLKFEIWIFRTTSDGETTKIKVVDLEKLYNFVVDNFFIWNHCHRKLRLNFSNLKFEFFKRPRMEKQPKQKLYISKSYTTW